MDLFLVCFYIIIIIIDDIIQEGLQRLVSARRYTEEATLARRKLQEAEATLGTFHPDLTEYLETLAKAYERCGESRKADHCYARILKIWEKAFVPDYGLRRLISDILGRPLSKKPPEILYTPKRIIKLKEELLLHIGDNRICYIHPDDPKLCIKIDKPWNDSLYNTRKKRVKRVFMPWLADFSSNRQEARIYWKKARRLGEIFYRHAPRCYGIVTTDRGPGLVFERILNDEDGTESLRLGLYLERHPEEAGHVFELLKELYRHLVTNKLFFYTWGSSHLIFQKREDGDRIVIVDWKSESKPNKDLPIINLCPYLKRKRMMKKFLSLKEKIPILWDYFTRDFG